MAAPALAGASSRARPVPPVWGEVVGSPPSPPRPWQVEKSARRAMYASFAVPGLGQLYNERPFWAVVVAGIEYYFIGTWVSEQRLTNRYREMINADPDDTEARVLFELHRDNRIQATWLLGVTILLSGLQAFVDAHLADFDARPLPLQVAPAVGGGADALLLWRF